MDDAGAGTETFVIAFSAAGLSRKIHRAFGVASPPTSRSVERCFFTRRDSWQSRLHRDKLDRVETQHLQSDRVGDLSVSILLSSMKRQRQNRGWLENEAVKRTKMSRTKETGCQTMTMNRQRQPILTRFLNSPKSPPALAGRRSVFGRSCWFRSLHHIPFDGTRPHFQLGRRTWSVLRLAQPHSGAVSRCWRCRVPLRHNGCRSAATTVAATRGPRSSVRHRCRFSRPARCTRRP